MRNITHMLQPPIYELVQWLAFWLNSFQDRQIASSAAKGLKFNTFRGSADYIAGNNEVPVQEFLAEHLKQGDIFYDVGANIGFFSILAAHLVGDKGHVYAFEPIPLNVACIRRNIRINQFQNVDVIAKAVSDHDGQLSIQVTYHPGGATLEGAGIAGDAYSTMTVNTITLDGLLKHSSMPAPDFLKIDVEGAEYHVLQGMRELLAQHHPLILYEIDAADQADFQQKQARCRALLEAANYHISELPNAYPDIEHNVAHFVALPSR